VNLRDRGQPRGPFLFKDSPLSNVLLPQADRFDSAESLESALEKAATAFQPASALSTSLAHLLMWRDEFPCALVQKGPLRAIVALHGKYVHCPVPPFPFDRGSLETLFEYMKAVNGPGPGISRVEGLTEAQKDLALSWGFASRPTLLEYLYDRDLLSGLHGDPYRAKRAEVNHLLKTHSVVLRPYRRTDLGPCGELYEAWKAQRLPSLKGAMGESMLRSSQKAHFRALHEGEEGGLAAWVVLVDGRLAAYTAGSQLAPDTYGIHLEVADLTIKGLSAYIFANVCRQLEGFPLINAGDAEGLPHLAEAKEHWHPVRHLQLHAIDPA